MLAFALRRILTTIPVVLVVITIVFFAMRAIGGNPFRHGPLLGLSNVAWVKYGDPKPEAIQRNMDRLYGRDLPWYHQYANFVRGVFTFDLGPSIALRGRRVTDIITEQGPRSLQLGLLAFAWAVAIGVPAGLFAALRPGSLLDLTARFLASVGLALPSFLVGTLLIYVFAGKLGWLPTSGWTQGWRHKVLPSLALGLLPAAYLLRLVRGSALETLQQDWVRTARAKGLRSPRIVWVHVLRGSLLPALTAAGPLLGYLVAGSFVIEQVFAIPGIGRYYIAAVLARDYPVMMGLTVLLAVVIVLANLVVDLLHAVLDPRTREARA